MISIASKKQMFFYFLSILVGYLLYVFRFNFRIVKYFLNNCLEEKKSYRSSHQTYSIIKGVLRNFAKFTDFSCEFCEISKNTSGRLLLKRRGLHRIHTFWIFISSYSDNTLKIKV